MTDTTNYADIIDSRDIIARIEEIETSIDAAASAGFAFDDLDGQLDIDDDDIKELASLRALAVQGETLDDWQHGETLVRETYFQTYAQEYAEDMGMDFSGLSWPLTCIDWAQAARELQMDYTSLDYDGVTYFAR